MLPIQRWSGQAPGRSRAGAYQGMVWTVATSDDESADVQAQARRCLELLDESLAAAGTDKTRLLSGIPLRHEHQGRVRRGVESVDRP